MRQFLNRVPDNTVHTPAFASYLERYVQLRRLNHDHRSKSRCLCPSCFAVLAFTVIYLLNAQYSGGAVQYRTYLRYAGGPASPELPYCTEA